MRRVALWGMLLALAGCVGGRTGAGGPKGRGQASRKGIEEFFLGDGKMQYYLLPVRLKGPAGRTADLDITVRDTLATVQWMTLRATLSAETRYPATDTVLVYDGQGWQALSPLKILFTEPDGKKTLTRVEAAVPPGIAKAVQAHISRGILLGTAGGRQAFVPTAKAGKRLAAFGGL